MWPRIPWVHIGSLLVFRVGFFVKARAVFRFRFASEATKQIAPVDEQFRALWNRRTAAVIALLRTVKLIVVGESRGKCLVRGLVPWLQGYNVFEGRQCAFFGRYGRRVSAPAFDVSGIDRYDITVHFSSFPGALRARPGADSQEDETRVTWERCERLLSDPRCLFRLISFGERVEQSLHDPIGCWIDFARPPELF